MNEIKDISRENRCPGMSYTDMLDGDTRTPPDYLFEETVADLGDDPIPVDPYISEEWARLESRFGPLMNGRDRVVQVSTQSSGTWYRLRASGFADRDDARRFCAALQAEGAECIAVVVN